VSSTQLQASILEVDLASPGTVSITVAHPAPGGDVSNALTYIIQEAGYKCYLPLIVR